MVDRDLVEFAATSIVGNKAAADVVGEVNAKPATIFAADDALCPGGGDQLAVEVSVVFVNYNVLELGHVSASFAIRLHEKVSPEKSNAQGAAKSFLSNASGLAGCRETRASVLDPCPVRAIERGALTVHKVSNDIPGQFCER